EDGILDRNVTGVQTCALPICCAPGAGFHIFVALFLGVCFVGVRMVDEDAFGCGWLDGGRRRWRGQSAGAGFRRVQRERLVLFPGPEERRVGTGYRTQGP